MGQNPAKFFPPPAPYGASQASNTVNPVAPAAVNPQTPLLPPNFTDPGATVFGSGTGNPGSMPGKATGNILGRPGGVSPFGRWNIGQ